ncbi:putative 2-nitropropane dioxygenase [Hyaloraphidium curvatum]|nr:putative 2-nitropropane dioxygenase [Hyaloraphidium curvatum]
MVPFSNRVTALLGVPHPVLLAPMAFVSDARLACAVTAAGGLGFLGGGYGDAEWLNKELAYAAEQGARVGVGFITWSLERNPALLDIALAAKPAAIALSFGDPRPFAPKIRAAGIPLLCQVQTLDHAREAAEAGADVLVAQGTEAGGHGASLALFPFLPAVVDAFPHIPVIAAGGIADGRGLAAALALGAEGCWLGSRFYSTLESPAHPDAKKRVVAAKAGDTLRTSVFDISRRIAWPEPWDLRAIRNTHSDKWVGKELDLLGRPEEADRYDAARDAGDFDVAAVIVGEAAGLINDVPPAGEVLRRIVDEATGVLRKLASKL